MRRCAKLFSLTAIGVALIFRCQAQSYQLYSTRPQPAPASPPADQVRELPSRSLIFSAVDTVSTFKPSPVIILPMQCTGDGALFFDMLQPPSFMQQAVDAVTSKSSHSFDLSSIRDLHGVELKSFFPSSDHIALLVRATKEAAPLPRESSVRQSAYGFFVARFNRQGEYLESVELEMPNLLPSHIAELSTGEYLVTTYDRANDLPRLYLVSQDGQILRPINLPARLGQYVPSEDPNSGQGMMNSSRVLGAILMTAHGDQVLVWRRGGNAPVLSMGAHGSTREINLNVPKGMVLNGVLSSDKYWIAQLEPAKQADQPRDPHQSSYYQFDPSDGTLTSKLTIQNDTEHPPTVIACEEDGAFLSYQADERGHTRILSAR